MLEYIASQLPISYNIGMYSKKDINKFIIFLSDLLALENIPSIEIAEVPYPRYSFLANKIILNNKDFNDRLLIVYLAHEMYHAYQFQNQFDGIEKCFKNYYAPDKDNKKYYTQEFELEAFAFQTFIMSIIGIDLDYTESHPNLPDISGRVEAMYYDFRKEEILSALEYSGLNTKKLCNKMLNFGS